MNSQIDKLAELFESFPGIGKRQARRFVYFILHKDPSYVNALVKNIGMVKQEINQCNECYRFYTKSGNLVCPICTNAIRSDQLMLVEKDADLENLHKTHIYEGKYFVLGGFISPNEKKRSYARTDQFLARVKRDLASGVLSEIIFGLSVSPEAEHTRLRITTMLRDQFPDIKISTLGRGLSTGTELEYSDTETLKYALNSRISE